MIDMTILITGLIALFSSVIFIKLWPLFKSILPMTLMRVLQQVAKYFVYAAEAEVGHGHGADKFDMALSKTQAFLERYHLTFDKEAVKNAIRQEWLSLNMAQLNSGMKK